MVSALFQQEISSLESQVAALQAQIAQAQTRVAALSECEADAEGMLQVVQKTLGKVNALAPDGVATLKSAVFALFNIDDSDSDGGQPISPTLITPAPQPDQPVLDGQSTDIACCLEDAPESALVGQVVEIMCPATSNVTAIYNYQEQDSAEKNLFDLISVSATVAYMRKNDGEIICAYAGFNNKTKAKQWGEWLAVHHSVASGFEVREAKRLTDYKHEVKLWGMSLKQIDRLAGCDLMKSPPSNYGDAPKRKIEPVPSMLDIGVGDTVRSITVKNWEWKVVKINSDGFYECDRIGANPPITQVLHPGSVELLSKGDVVDAASAELAEYLEQQAQDAIASIQEPLSQAAKIDRDDVPAGTRLFPISDDLLTEFEVWMQTEVRVMGRTQRQQKQIGLLIQTAFGIEAYRPRASVCKVFTRTLDAVAYLIQGSGLKPLPIAEEPVLVGTATIDDEF